MILEQTLQGNYSFWGQILQRNYSYSQPTSWSWDTRQLQSWSWSWDKHYKAITVSWTNIKRQLLSKSTTVMFMGHALQLQSTHVMILGHIYCMAVSQSTHCHDPGTHTLQAISQPMSQSWDTYYKAFTVTHTLQGNYNQPMAWSWDTHYKAITVTYILQGNYSQPMSWSWDACIPRQLQS